MKLRIIRDAIVIVSADHKTDDRVEAFIASGMFVPDWLSVLPVGSQAAIERAIADGCDEVEVP